MFSWTKALSKVCELYFSSKMNSNLEWILVGSVGSVLQGCEMTPGDVDIYTRNKEGTLTNLQNFLKNFPFWINVNFLMGITGYLL